MPSCVCCVTVVTLFVLDFASVNETFRSVAYNRLPKCYAIQLWSPLIYAHMWMTNTSRLKCIICCEPPCHHAIVWQ